MLWTASFGDQSAAIKGLGAPSDTDVEQLKHENEELKTKVTDLEKEVERLEKELQEERANQG